MIENAIKTGDGVFHNWPPEISEKYEYLVTHESQIQYFNRLILDEDGGTRRIEQYLKDGMDIFRFYEEAREVYQHLMPPNFEPDVPGTFEVFLIKPFGGTARLEQRMREGRNILLNWEDSQEVQAKYGHLVWLLPHPEINFDHYIEKHDWILSLFPDWYYSLTWVDTAHTDDDGLPPVDNDESDTDATSTCSGSSAE